MGTIDLARSVLLQLLPLPYPVAAPAQIGDTFPARVVPVADGDTTRVRLDGIDTPETDQPFGVQARTFTSTRILN